MIGNLNKTITKLVGKTLVLTADNTQLHIKTSTTEKKTALKSEHHFQKTNASHQPRI